MFAIVTLILLLNPTAASSLRYSCVSLSPDDSNSVCKATHGGKYVNDPQCYGECSLPSVSNFSCHSDWDCSLAGECNIKTGRCMCDAWSTGPDCSFLNLQPVDRMKLGYRHPNFSSWGGNMLHEEGAARPWHLYMAEINCNNGTSPCGLHGWGKTSQVGHAVSESPLGPYTRVGLALPPQHHNPTVQRAPNGSLLMYSISCCSNGKISVASASDFNGPWTEVNKAMAPWTNPGPFVNATDNTLTLAYRTSGTVVPCSAEAIAIAKCKTFEGGCSTIGQAFSHTGEDPSVFVDARGNFHMLTNAYPGGCKPKKWQGGHAWSRDGVTWSEPRAGVFSTSVNFTDGTSMTCVRRERPQMVMDTHGRPAYLVTGITGCPKNLTPVS